MQEPHHTQSIANRDDDDIRILFQEIETVKHGVDGSARFKSTAVNPHHHRLLRGGSIVRLKHIQIQAGLVHIVHGTHFKFRVAVGTLRVVIGLIHAIVRTGIHRCLPAQVANGLPANVGDAPVDNDILLLPAHEGAVDTPHGERPVVLAVFYLPVLATKHGVQRVSDFLQFHNPVFCCSLFLLFIMSTHVLDKQVDEMLRDVGVPDGMAHLVRHRGLVAGRGGLLRFCHLLLAPVNLGAHGG